MNWDERTVVTRVKRMTLRDLRLWVREGWVQPAQGESGPIFDDLDVARLRLLCDLRKDMAIPTDVVPAVLTLIDHLHKTRRDLRLLADALEEQPVDVRHAIASAVRRRRQASD